MPDAPHSRPDIADLGKTRVSPSSGAADAPARFGRYELQGEIARGGMGVVYRARQLDMQRTVALKVLLSGDFASEDEEKRFVREAELAAQLSHPNIVAVHDIGREGGRRFFTMELVDGVPLDKWARERPLADRLRCMARICRAVHHAHMKGIIHRDLKPGNILVTAAAEPKVLDFGLAKATAPGAASMNTVSGAAIGTPFYMAPEQAAGRIRDIDIRTDVFALGVILYEIVAGTVPFRGESLMEVLQRIQSEEPPRLNGPADLRLVVAKAMEKEKARRYPTADALAEDIERFLAGEPISARPASIPFLTRRWMKRHPAKAAGAAGAAVVAIAALGWWLSRPGEIAFVSTTPGAWFEIDGRPVKSTGAQVAAGRHRVRAGAPGYVTESREDVDVERGESRSLDIPLRRETVPVRLTCDTEAATVEIEGRVYGLPLLDQHLPTGDYDVRVQSRGRWTLFREIAAGPGKTVSVDWPDIPSAGHWASRIADGTAGFVKYADIDGDGVPDMRFLNYSSILALDGRTGQFLRMTRCAATVDGVDVRWFDLDDDGIEDDIVVERSAGDLAVRAFSAAQPEIDGAGSTSSRIPGQRLLWEKSYPFKGVASASLLVGDEIWMPFDSGILRVAARDGSVLGRVDLPYKPSVARVAGSGVLVTGRHEARLFSARGDPVWTATLEGDWAPAVPSPIGLGPVPALPGILLHQAGRARALRVEDGTVLWTASVPWNDALWEFTASGEDSPARVVAVSGEQRLAVFDCAQGHPVFEKTLSGKLRGLFPGIALSGDGKVLVCTRLRDGSERWRADLSSPLAIQPAYWQGRGDEEVHLLTSDRKLVALGAADGRLRREAVVSFLSSRIEPIELDGDGRSDTVLWGFGVQRFLSNRVLWSRLLSNDGRSRPVVAQTHLGPIILYQDRWADTGVKSLRAFDGLTGAERWRTEVPMDPVREPTLQDFDGDGVPEVWALGSFEGAGISVGCLGAADGRLLALYPMGEGDDVYAPPGVVDVDGDGSPEVALYGYRKGFRILARDGKAPFATADAPMTMWTPFIGDLDGDGRPEFVASWGTGDNSGEMRAIRVDGTTAWSTALEDNLRSQIVGADFDGYGKPELVVAGRRDLFVISRKGELLSRWPGFGGGAGGCAPVDLDGDGRDEIFAGTTTGFALLRADGSAIWTHPCDEVRGRVAVTALPRGRTALGIDAKGRLWALDLATGREAWHSDLGGGSECGLTLADVTGDGIPEALAGLMNQRFVVVDLR
ncbi:MAG: protein kinase [Candidatus Brocadiae bacterium]|nr:protein kinase [Candidatus Brocadiia bacterium]